MNLYFSTINNVIDSCSASSIHVSMYFTVLDKHILFCLPLEFIIGAKMEIPVMNLIFSRGSCCPSWIEFKEVRMFVHQIIYNRAFADT